MIGFSQEGSLIDQYNQLEVLRQVHQKEVQEAREKRAADLQDEKLAAATKNGRETAIYILSSAVQLGIGPGDFDSLEYSISEGFAYRTSNEICRGKACITLPGLIAPVTSMPLFHADRFPVFKQAA